MKKPASISLCLGILFWVAMGQQAPSVLAATEVLSPNSVSYGRTYSEWVAAWNQWATSTPLATHPLFDNPQTTEAAPDVGTGQSGPVWFLGGKFCEYGDTSCTGTATRYMTVPRNTALFFPLLDYETSMLEYPKTTNLINGLRQISAPVMGRVSGLSVAVDGTEILTNQDLIQNYRIQSQAFGFMLPQDNIFRGIYAKKKTGNFPAGTYFPGVDDGYFVMLKLDPGPHILHFTGTFDDWDYTIDITYHITVTP